MRLRCRALAGAWCFVHCTSDSCFHYFMWNSAGVPDCSWHDREVKHLQRKRFGLYSGGIGHNLQFYPFCLCFTLWFGWPILGRYLQELQCDHPNCFFTLHHLGDWSMIPVPSLHPLFLLPMQALLFVQEAASAVALCAHLPPLWWNCIQGWIWLIALASKDPKGSSYCISQLLLLANANSNSCVVSEFFGRIEAALSPHAYYKRHFQPCAAVINRAQLGNFNPLPSSLGLLVMQPAFTQHNGCYLPMCFEGYC